MIINDYSVMTSRLHDKQTLDGSLGQTSRNRKNLFLIRAVSKHSTHRVLADHQQARALLEKGVL